jgi:hypothetical protein
MRKVFYDFSFSFLVTVWFEFEIYLTFPMLEKNLAVRNS